MENRSDPVNHLVCERWQLINPRAQGGMFIHSPGKGAGRMHVSRFGVLVTVTNVSST